MQIYTQIDLLFFYDFLNKALSNVIYLYHIIACFLFISLNSFFLHMYIFITFIPLITWVIFFLNTHNNTAKQRRFA